MFSCLLERQQSPLALVVRVTRMVRTLAWISFWYLPGVEAVLAQTFRDAQALRAAVVLPSLVLAVSLHKAAQVEMPQEWHIQTMQQVAGAGQPR